MLFLHGGAPHSSPVKKAPKSPQERVGLRIRELRMESGRTQEELAAELGIAVQNVARTEQGRVDMRISTLFRYIEALELDDPGEILREPTIAAARPGRPKQG